jgi:conserved hypothetical protein
MEASKQDWLNIFKLLSDSVNEANNRLNEYLQDFIDSNNHKMITGKQNRIKSDVSFVDKLIRNNYISNWEYDEGNDDANKKTLSSSLPDFIGYRINTLFFNEEEKFANELINFLKEKEHIEIPDNQLNPNNQQANGHLIMKFQGFVKSVEDPELKFGFEIQIKSSVHNLWGEVEHGSIYKPNNFDFRIDEKKKNVEEIWNTLTSCDRQLYLLSKETYEKDKLLKQLLTIYLQESNLVEPLNSHYLYSIFFNIFIRKNINVMEELLIQLMSNQKIERKSNFNFINLKDNIVYDDLNKMLSTILHPDELESIKKIFEHCFESIEHESFLDVIIFSIIKNYISDSENEVEDKGLDIYNDDEDEEVQKYNKTSLLGALEINGFKTKRIKLDESK